MPELIPDFDLYAELEVPASATSDAIETAWRARIRRSHPDVGPAGSIERTVRLNIAHDWLTDAVRRARYDAARSAERAAAGAAARRQAPAPADAQSGPGRAGRWASRARPVRLARRPRPGIGGHLVGMATGAALVAGGVLAVATVLGGLAGSPGAGPAAQAGSPPPAEAASGAGPSGAPPPTVVPATPSPLPTLSPSPPPTPTPMPSPTASPVTTPILSVPPVTGSGSSADIPMDLSTGSYAIGYAITGPADATCGWVLWLRDASGLETLAASAYPLPGETVRDTELDAFVAAGSATARVESDCPRWTFRLTFAGP